MEIKRAKERLICCVIAQSKRYILQEALVLMDGRTDGEERNEREKILYQRMHM